MNMNKICPLLSKNVINSKSQLYSECLREDNYNKACGIASMAWFQAQTAEVLDKK